MSVGPSSSPVSQRMMSMKCTPLSANRVAYRSHQRNLNGVIVAWKGREGRGPSHISQSRSLGGSLGAALPIPSGNMFVVS